MDTVNKIKIQGKVDSKLRACKVGLDDAFYFPLEFEFPSNNDPKIISKETMSVTCLKKDLPANLTVGTKVLVLGRLEKQPVEGKGYNAFRILTAEIVILS